MSKSKKEKSSFAKATADKQDVVQRILQLEEQMKEAAERLDFEKAIALRAEWQQLQTVKK